MDMHEIAALLHIEEKTRAHPQLKELHDATMMELQKHNAEYLPKTVDEVPPTAGPLTLGALQEDTPTNGRRI